MTARQIEIEFLVTIHADPIYYRKRVARRAAELGWPQPHSGGLNFSNPRHSIADLAWELDGDVDVTHVLTKLAEEFHLASVIGAD
jgi:hypothetical protein